MKKFVLTIALVALLASPSYAQLDAFGLYADNQGLNCNITIPVFAPSTIYVVHKSPNGATGSQFKVVAPTSATFLSTGGGVGNAAFLVIGDPYTDLSLAYTSCVSGDFLVWNLSFFATAAVPDCSYISIVPAPGKPYAITVNCNFAELEAYPGQGIISPTGACSCNVGAEASTWGKVKSLYR